MYWVKINGKDSRDVDGLFVASLPPITKPEMRVESLVIDGKDGDKLTQLGYSAYDKELIIITLRDADIDEIIEYFEPEGEIVFSNEPEKFYEYRLVEQVDYEQVIKMRKAEIEFHVQPHKYPAEDRERLFDSPTSPIKVTNYGNELSAPIYTITGQGTVTLSLNGTPVLAIAFGAQESTIKIDVAELEAVAVPSGAYVNRSISGNYGSLKLKVGRNEIAWTGGTISRLKMEKFTRWI